MNLEEAEIEVIRKNASDVKEFCPLTKETCRTDCVCWQQSYPKDYGDDKYIATEPHCGNMMFWRECERY